MFENSTAKIRLHKVVADYVKSEKLEYTASEIKKNITQYGVLVEDKLEFNHLFWIYPHQVWQIQHWPKRVAGNLAEVKILYENPELFLLYKPINVVVEAGAGHLQDNLEFFLNQDRKDDIQAVHRLDKDTQGLILFAKGAENLQFLQDQFRSRKVVKKYLAIVQGLVEKVYVVENWQARSKIDVMKQKLFWTEKEAMEYSPQARFCRSTIKPKLICPELNQSLVEIQIFTGRMHQIRLQCQALGFPLVKDIMYFAMPEKKHSCKSFYQLNPIISLQEQDFTAIKKNVFGNTEYCLLSNYLRLIIPKNTHLEAIWKEII